MSAAHGRMASTIIYSKRRDNTLLSSNRIENKHKALAKIRISWPLSCTAEEVVFSSCSNSTVVVVWWWCLVPVVAFSSGTRMLVIVVFLRFPSDNMQHELQR